MDISLLGFLSTGWRWTTVCPHCNSSNRLPVLAEVSCQLLGLFIAAPLIIELGISPNWLSAALGVGGWLVLGGLFRMLYLRHGALIRS